MRLTAKKLDLRIAETEKLQSLFLHKRDEMRQALRDHLSDFEKSELGGIARRMNISIVQLSNLKGGYSIPSLATAKEVLRVTGC